ncbi:MAG: trypsin-like peptidase domain-containing protein [Pirellulaceae bacterium]
MMHTLCFLLLAAGLSGGDDAILLEFTQPGCEACVAMQPAMKQLRREGVAVRSVDAARESHLLHRYRVTALPTYIVVAGGREVTRLQGAQRIETLRDALINRQGDRIRNTGARTAQPQSPQTVMASVPTAIAGRADSRSLSTETMPSVDLANAVERAQAATVRIRVREQGAVGVATGTIIDTHGAESLVLTCGHVFRDSQGKAPIEVDVFVQGEVRTVPGQLIDYDADTRDVGLVAIKTGYPIPPVPVISVNQTPATGTSAFSFGCDRGADPTRRDTRITAVNKYNQNIGASNLEIAGAPTIGRSGGGLFDQQGRLIGVCNAADFEDNIGIYAGPGAVQWQLDRVNLSHLYKPSPADNMYPEAPTRLVDSRNAPTSRPATSPLANDSEQEMIVILRDKNRPDGTTKVKTFDRPPAEILKLLGTY